jgi:hypothetical protein
MLGSRVVLEHLEPKRRDVHDHVADRCTSREPSPPLERELDLPDALHERHAELVHRSRTDGAVGVEAVAPLKAGDGGGERAVVYRHGANRAAYRRVGRCRVEVA